MAMAMLIAESLLIESAVESAGSHLLTPLPPIQRSMNGAEPWAASSCNLAAPSPEWRAWI
ncbi:hypothetical protein NSPZN2_80033 [Nitrospira defluvii]|uniref:Uncharacterized protein n=1 Tax=Nitrospira defluvii TaxID=330214 RepID=A0ABM8SBZ4_9BACT|nr:hypothetical protein NSPZN2_80033 [Nitrospira defluvii]